MGAGQPFNTCPKFCCMTAYDVGLLILRVVLGLTLAAHGYNKFCGPGGLKGTAGWFDSMGMKPGMFHARVAATAEMSAGIGLALRLLTNTTATTPAAGVGGNSPSATPIPL